MTDNRQAWADFWTAGGAPCACLPRALHGIDDSQRALWQDFARRLKKGARVLDLGTGDGAVLKKMRSIRPDLELTGVDSSPVLPPPPAGISTHPSVAMESLPFAEGSFDAATSQFGFEYGDTKAGAFELARVLRTGGRIVFAMHMRDGPILEHNLSRREALKWALGSGWLEKARAVAAERATRSVPTPSEFNTEAVDEAKSKFPDQPVAGEFIQAITQTLELGFKHPASETAEVLNTLEKKALNEIARIDTLERAACDEDRVSEISSQLKDAGIMAGGVDELVERSTRRSFAWLLWGERQPR